MLGYTVKGRYVNPDGVLTNLEMNMFAKNVKEAEDFFLKI